MVLPNAKPEQAGRCCITSLIGAYCHHRVRHPIEPSQCPWWVCAVTRRRFPVGASPTRQPLQREATGAVMEVTKWLTNPTPAGQRQQCDFLGSYKRSLQESAAQSIAAAIREPS
jgi:hypothetical protein